MKQHLLGLQVGLQVGLHRNMHLEKDAVALERPGPVHCAVCALYLPACGLGALCIPKILLLTEPIKRPALLLASIFTRSSLESSSTSPFPNLTSCLNKPAWCLISDRLISAVGVDGEEMMLQGSGSPYSDREVRFSFLTPRSWKVLICIRQACFWLMCLPEIWIFPQAQSLLNRECYRQALHNLQHRSLKAKKSIFFCL